MGWLLDIGSGHVGRPEPDHRTERRPGLRSQRPVTDRSRPDVIREGDISRLTPLNFHFVRSPQISPPRGWLKQSDGLLTPLRRDDRGSPQALR